VVADTSQWKMTQTKREVVEEEEEEMMERKRRGGVSILSVVPWAQHVITSVSKLSAASGSPVAEKHCRGEEVTERHREQAEGMCHTVKDLERSVSISFAIVSIN